MEGNKEEVGGQEVGFPGSRWYLLSQCFLHIPGVKASQTKGSQVLKGIIRLDWVLRYDHSIVFISRVHDEIKV